MNIAELGFLIKEKRQSKNLTIEDISNAIKIPVKSLIALEQGDMDQIGYETYYKNFLKCYVLYLGYSFEEYQEFIKETEEFSTQIVPPKSLETKLAENQLDLIQKHSKKLVLQLFVFAVIGGSAYFFFSQKDAILSILHGGENEPVIETKEADVLAKPKAIVVDVNQTDHILDDKENNTANAINDSQHAGQIGEKPDELVEKQIGKNEKLNQADKNIKEDTAVVKNDSKADVALVQQKLLEEQSDKVDFDMEKFLKENPSAKVIDWSQVTSPVKGEQQAVLYAKQDCWMQYTIDGKSSHFTLKQGEQRVFNFKKSLNLRIANGLAITLYHNKKQITVGDSTKIREINLK